jgi:hypothetical protein
LLFFSLFFFSSFSHHLECGQVTEPVSQNYYPINSATYIQDAQSRFALLTDRSQGGILLFLVSPSTTTTTTTTNTTNFLVQL